MQIGEILKKKHLIFALYEANVPEINKLLYDCNIQKHTKNVYPGRPQLKEKGKEIAIRLGKPHG